ncbi:MAG: peptidase E [Candidatus Marinimicrobia bacterium]|nr:peptidase E [Candidatus Neomarinimicrobiota bacterium]|tara:strand:- start:718 stop:1422 length:705 start_codon:yes stop_codon:yes gene_type:complete
MTKDKGHIIAIGGGGFGRTPDKPIIEKYILDQSKVKNPNICFFPTASAERQDYIDNYYKAFSTLDCNPTHISLFSRTPDLESEFDKSDIIYIGGGNTKSMLAVFQEWNINQLLLKAYENGKILAGVSAGAICWFNKGITDSWADELKVLDCLDFLPGCCCPHYDGEKDRRPSVMEFINSGIIESCLAIEDGAAAHFKNGKLLNAISFYKGANVFNIYNKDDKIYEIPMDSINIY